MNMSRLMFEALPASTAAPGWLEKWFSLAGSAATAQARTSFKVEYAQHHCADYASLLSWEAARAYWAAWEDLSGRALEANAFMTPAFALSAVQHLPAARRPQFLFTWSDRPGHRDRLTGVFALHLPMPGAGQMAWLWSSPMMALGVPLIDRDEGLAAIGSMQRYIASHFRHVQAVMMPHMTLHGPVAELIGRHGAMHDLTIDVFDRCLRAVVSKGGGENISPKKLKELKRQRRRLQENGILTYTSARSPGDIRIAMERFLLLESSGWKGLQNTSLLSDPSTATFARSMTRIFAQQNACRIDALELDGVPIAMGIVLSAGATGFYWKTAFDERYARSSPGMLFSIEMTGHIMDAGAHEQINSCAIADHPMIDQIWRERVEMGDLCVATLNGAPQSFAGQMAKENTRRKLRSYVKSAYHALKRS